MIRRPVLVAVALLASACGSSEAAGPTRTPPATPTPTIGGVGALPDTIARESEPPVIIPPPVNEDGTAAELVGQQVAGNRLLMIGDSILAATERRFGGEMCAALVPLGWAVEIDAEPGRFVEFGTRVLDRRLDPGSGQQWDAAAVFLGSNYRGDRTAFEAELLEIVGRLAPRPTLLFTVTEYRPQWAEVNEVVERIADDLEHVRLVDWRTVAQTPGVLSSDRLHPTEAGELVLVDLTAAHLGRAPVGEGECLRTEFTDSSAITDPGPPASGGDAADAVGGWRTGTGSASTGTSTSVAGPVATSAPGGTTPTTTPGPAPTGGATTTAPPPSAPPPSAPPPTAPPPPTTAPPPTAPPPTAPPPTAPPPTAPPPTAPPPTAPPPTSAP